MAGPPQQAPRQSRLAIHNRQRPRQAEETVPSVRVTRATSDQGGGLGRCHPWRLQLDPVTYPLLWVSWPACDVVRHDEGGAAPIVVLGQCEPVAGPVEPL